jgi:hypothetical protein
MAKKNNAAPAATGDGGEHKIPEPKYTLNDLPPIQETYFLHVKDDGTELLFGAQHPRLPCLEIERRGEWEYTRTRNITSWSGASLRVTLVWPRGEGWNIWDAEPDKWTAWRRTASL